MGDATPYRSLCEYLDKPVKACLATDLEVGFTHNLSLITSFLFQLCAMDDYRLFGALIPFVFQSVPSSSPFADPGARTTVALQLKTEAMSSPELLHLIVGNLDPAQERELIGHIVQGSLTFFKKDSFTEILRSLPCRNS